MGAAESEACLRQGGCEDAPTREGVPPDAFLQPLRAPFRPHSPKARRAIPPRPARLPPAPADAMHTHRAAGAAMHLRPGYGSRYRFETCRPANVAKSAKAGWWISRISNFSGPPCFNSRLWPLPGVAKLPRNEVGQCAHSHASVTFSRHASRTTRPPTRWRAPGSFVTHPCASSVEMAFRAVAASRMLLGPY